MLVLDTGANWIDNAGLIESTGAGGLSINSSVFQDGSLIASGAGGITVDDGAIFGGLGQTKVLVGSKLVLDDAGYNSVGILDIGTAAAPGGLLTTTAGNLASTSTADFLDTTIFNYGMIDVVNNSELMLSVFMFNGPTGEIELNAATNAAILAMAASTTITSGSVVLGNNIKNEVFSDGSYDQLSNDSTISGSGVIGDGYLRLFNAQNGVIDADGTAGLTIVADTLAIEQSSANSTNFSVGLIEATAALSPTTGTGLLTFGAGIFSNAGEIDAAKQGKIVLDGALIENGGGQVDVSAGGAMLLEEAAVIYGQTDVTIAAGGALSFAGDGSTDELETSLYLNGTMTLGAKSKLLTESKWIGAGAVHVGTSTGAATITVAEGDNLDLLGGGIVQLMNAADKIDASGASANFRNRGDTIVGTGLIGDADLGIFNTLGGTIDATGAMTLGYSSSAPEIGNGGLIEATGSGKLTIASNINNQGDLLVGTGAHLTAEQNVYDSGRVDLDGGVASFDDVVNNQIYFESGVSSSLILANGNTHDGNVSGFGTGDTIDLTYFGFGNGKFTLSNNPTSFDVYLVLQNSVGATSVGLGLDGNYTASAGSFSFTKDASGGTIVHFTTSDT